MKENEIYVMYGKSYQAMAKELARLAGLAGRIPSREAKIGIKPNLVGQVLASDGATTHPEVVAGLIEYLQENGFRNLVLLEGSWVGDSTREALSFCGFDRVCEAYGVPFWDMQKDGAVERDCGGMELHICRKVEELDFLITARPESPAR